MSTDFKPAPLPSKRANTDYPLIDSDPHLRRVFGYARPSDYAVAGGMAAASPLTFWMMERVSPSHVGRGGFAPVMRLATAVGLIGGLHILYQRSCNRFYGFSENSREADMDMREMVDKVKTGQPLYGTSQVSPYLQGVAARNSRFSELFIHVIPWFNVVNHDQHGVDTAKYYQQAERELETERLAGGGSS
ncbi:putative NADH-ubiquinone oxidoreductase 21 kDa subunit [Aspergillus campestris IBT 28561]|uniref:NADH-ubiquinone oxidoreductase 21 kDa subunit n=1 Tax=Aspergillus campestris (strain IBT 28561) TaxID=1392248 RepID=A0A2I1CQK2_ASPC2|nr:putative NADH-ubiquinone oxidoreductase 21 kDa subunit [Aspergillus campestris IBT 28561]PKX99898.1 putative NADH-ubiquinone oxidoreductase 21 kDa subunit [Aspergillus campestris IBT 28561]